MSIASGYKLSWADIENIYNNLNAARTKFSMTTVSVPGNPGKIYPSQITDLSSLVDAMSANGFIGANAITGVSSPETGNKITPVEFDQINNVVTNIKDNICPHNAAHNATHRSSHNAAYRATHRSDYDGAYRATHRSSHDSGYRAAHRSSHNSGYRSSYRSGYRSSYRSRYFADYDSGCDAK